MKVAYVLAVLFFPFFLFVIVDSKEIKPYKIEAKEVSAEIDFSDYNFRTSMSDQKVRQVPFYSPKNSDFSVSNDVGEAMSVPKPKETVNDIQISNETTKIDIPAQPSQSDIVTATDHATFNDILKANVSKSGKVNYKGIKSQSKELQSYLDLVSKSGPSGRWSKNKQLAYWINVYNAFTIKLIVDNYPVKSITDIEGGKPWDKKWIRIKDKLYSLNNIENDIIRVEFDEPRIHFAVNCAAKSCPPLLNAAWTSANLNANLQSQTSKFINDKNYNILSSKNASISKIFDWYKEDFGNLISFLNRYAKTPVTDKTTITFKEYDWSLNE